MAELTDCHDDSCFICDEDVGDDYLVHVSNSGVSDQFEFCSIDCLQTFSPECEA